MPAALFEEWDMYGKFCEIYAGSVAIVTKATRPPGGDQFELHEVHDSADMTEAIIVNRD